MFDPKIKKEIVEDAFSKSRQKAFEEADKLAQAFIQKHWMVSDVDQVIDFLKSVQEVTGHFKISRDTPDCLNNFRL